MDVWTANFLKSVTYKNFSRQTKATTDGGTGVAREYIVDPSGFPKKSPALLKNAKGKTLSGLFLRKS